MFFFHGFRLALSTTAVKTAAQAAAKVAASQKATEHKQALGERGRET